MKKIILTTVLLIITAAAAFTQSATMLFQEGRDAFSDKLFSRSIESFKEFQEEYPSDPRVDQADYLIGVSYFYLKQFDKVISHFNQYERTYPGSAYNSRIHYWKGLSYYGKNAYQSAILELQKQAANKNEIYFLQKSLQLLGYSYEKTKQLNNAAEAYADLYDTNPGDELSALSLERQGFIKMEQGAYAEALVFFETVSVDFSHVRQIQQEIPFYQGECYYQLKDFSRSIKNFETFLTLYSDSENREQAVFRLGSLYAQTNKQQYAKEYMSLLADEFPDSEYIMQAHIILVESYMADGDFASARESLAKLLENEKDPVEIQKLQFNMARTWDEEPEEALKWYLSASKGLDPDISGESLYRSGIIHETLGENARTVLLFEKLFNQYRENEHREEVGDWIVLFYENNKQDLALKNHLDRMLSEYSESEKRTLYLYMLGNISYREGKHNEALRFYQNIINVESEDIRILNETRYRIGYIYTLRKEFYRASDYFEEVMRTGGRNELYYRSLLSLGICYLNVKENDKAESRFIEMLRSDNEWNPDARFYLGKIQMEKGNYQKAAEYYKASADTTLSNERKIQALYQLGWSQMRLARFSEASQAFDRVWSLDEFHSLAADSLYRSGTALSYLEEWQESLLRFEKALERIEYFGLREELLYQTAWSYFMLMDFEKAMTYLQDLESEFPGSPLPADGLFRAGESLGEMKETVSSVIAYRTLFDKYPENPLAETSLYRALSFTEDLEEKLFLMKTFLAHYTGNERSLQTVLQLEKILRKTKLSPFQDKTVDTILDMDISENERTIILLGRYANILDEAATLDKLNALSGIADLRSNEVIKIQLYKGITLFHSGNYLEAEEYFDSVMDGDISEYSAEAQFYTARMFFDRGEWKQAADEFIRIRYRYPDQSEWVQEGLYFSAISYRNAGDTDSYERTLGLLKEKFPDSKLLESLEDEEAGLDESSPEEETEASADNAFDVELLSPPDEILPALEN